MGHPKCSCKRKAEGVDTHTEEKRCADKVVAEVTSIATGSQMKKEQILPRP